MHENDTGLEEWLPNLKSLRYQIRMIDVQFEAIKFLTEWVYNQ